MGGKGTSGQRLKWSKTEGLGRVVVEHCSGITAYTAKPCTNSFVSCIECCLTGVCESKGAGRGENSKQKMPLIDCKLSSLLSSELLAYLNLTVIF